MNGWINGSLLFTGPRRSSRDSQGSKHLSKRLERIFPKLNYHALGYLCRVFLLLKKHTSMADLETRAGLRGNSAWPDRTSLSLSHCFVLFRAGLGRMMLYPCAFTNWKLQGKLSASFKDDGSTSWSEWRRRHLVFTWNILHTITEFIWLILLCKINRAYSTCLCQKN